MPTNKKNTPPTEPSAKPLGERLNEHFTDIADWVSSVMGTPTNIVIWLVLVLGWTLIFAVHPALQNANFLPGWFTSQTYNFPLNLITTVAELFIGFLVAAASNRIERRNHQQIQRLDKMDAQMLRMEREHGQELAELHKVLVDLHAHTYCSGHTTIEDTIQPNPTPLEETTPTPAKRTRSRKAAA